MLAYYATRISEHMSRTPEGFLICHNVPIARTGSQDYLPTEIGLTGDNSSLVKVYRTEDEVFSDATLASFEGKPVTLDHPPTAVDPSNYGVYLKGHAENVHRGTGADADLILADLFINDQELIRQIDNGLREVSCGYECEYMRAEDGQIHQCKIRGNHVAVVAAGRAGNRVSIKDSAPPEPTHRKKGEKTMSNSPKKPSVLARLFAGWAADAEPEEVAQTIDEIMETGAMEEPVEDPAMTDEDPVAPAPEMAPEAPVMADEEPSNAEIKAMLEQVLAALGKAPAAPADPIDQLTDEIAPAAEEEVEPVPTQEANFVVPAEEMGKDADPTEDPMAAATIPADEPDEQMDRACDSAGTIAALKTAKKWIAKLPAADRKAASDELVAEVRKARGMDAKPTTDGYAAVMRIQNQTAKARAKKANDAKPVDEADLGRQLMAKYNPHYKTNK